MQQLLRTQIYLPEDLRHEIDKDRREAGESLAAYLRKAAEERLANRKKKRTDLKKLADEVIGSLKISQNEAEEWIKEIREDRRLSDERLERQWTEAQKLKKRSR